jgi:hypothetical protein
MKPGPIQNDPLRSKLWDTYQPLLADKGKWRDEYSPHFAVLIDALGEWVEITAKLQDPDNAPLLTNTKKGTVYRNPAARHPRPGRQRHQNLRPGVRNEPARRRPDQARRHARGRRAV